MYCKIMKALIVTAFSAHLEVDGLLIKRVMMDNQQAEKTLTQRRETVMGELKKLFGHEPDGEGSGAVDNRELMILAANMGITGDHQKTVLERLQDEIAEKVSRMDELSTALGILNKTKEDFELDHSTKMGKLDQEQLDLLDTLTAPWQAGDLAGQLATMSWRKKALEVDLSDKLGAWYDTKKKLELDLSAVLEKLEQDLDEAKKTRKQDAKSMS